MNYSQETLFAQFILHRKLASKDALQRAESIKREYTQQGKNLSLAQILIKQGVISQQQAAEIFKEVHKFLQKSNPSNETEGPIKNSPDTKRTLPKQIGKYQILSELGRGGMGVVYKAYDEALDRHVALKIISNLAASDTYLKRFQQEAKATAKLNHDNIVKVYEVGEQPCHYFTMEYIQGQGLNEHIKKADLDLKAMALIIRKIALALHYAHENGIVHRDIKPVNIMISAKKEPILMDFGLAKIVDNQLSATGEVLGTPAYMSPEQANGSKNVGKRSDIYSLGATLYEILTGRPPFQGVTYANIVDQIFHREPVRPRDLNPDIPLELEAICLKCLEKQKRLRYNSASELAQDLENFLEKRMVTARPPTAFTYLLKWINRNKTLATISILAFLVIVIGSISFMIALKYKHDAAVAAKKQTERALEIAEQQKSQALINEAQAKANENRAKLNEINGKLKESQAYIVIAQLKSQERDYHTADSSLTQALQKIQQAQEILNTLKQLEINAQKEHQDILKKIEILQRQIHDFQRFLVVPNLTRPIKNISFPEGYEAYKMEPSWKWAVLKQDRDHAIVWDLQTQKPLQKMEHEHTIIAVTASEHYVATGDQKGYIQIWDSRNNKIIPLKFRKLNRVIKLGFNETGDILYISDLQQFIIWDIKNSTILSDWNETGLTNTNWELSYDQKYLVVSEVVRGFASTLYAIDRSKKPWSFTLTHNFLVAGFAMSFRKDSQRVAIAGRERILVRDISENKEQTILGVEGIISLDWDPNHRFLLSLQNQGFSLYNNFSLQKALFVPLSQKDMFAAVFHPTDSLVGIWSKTGIQIYSIEDAICHKMTTQTKVDSKTKFYQQHFKSIVHQSREKSQGSLATLINELRVEISPDNNLVAIAYFKHFLAIWNTVQKEWYIIGEHSQIKSMHFLDNNRLVTNGRDLIKIWEVHDKKLLASHQISNINIDIHKNRHTAATVFTDGVTLLNFKDYRFSNDFKIAFRFVVRVKFHEQQELLAFSTLQQTHIYDLQKRSIINSIDISATAMCFHSEYLAIGCRNGDYLVWNWKTNEIEKQMRFSTKIEKIKFYQGKYSIITENSVHIDYMEQNTSPQEISVYPIELFPGYYKGHPAAISQDFTRLVFLSPNFNVLMFSLQIQR